MNAFRILSAAVVGLMILSGCASYPLGMSEEEWGALSPQQQYEARAKQAELDEQAAQRAAEEKARAEQLAWEREQARLAHMRELYATGKYGDFVQCLIRRPIVDFHPGWREALPVAFTLVKGEEKTVGFIDPKRGRHSSMWVRFALDGMRVDLCRYDPGETRRPACDSLVASFRDLQRGVHHEIRLPDLVQGTLECDWAPARGMPQTIIIDRDD